MSFKANSQVTGAKICVVCGVDVSQRKRQKDRAGRYFCEICAHQLAAQNQHEANGTPTSGVTTPATDELIFCEICSGYAAADQMILHKGRVVCRDCKKSGAVKISINDITEEIGDVSSYVFTTNTMIVLSIFTTIFFPIGSVMQFLTMKRLMRLSGRQDEWGWTVAASVPCFGLIALKLMANRAEKVIHRSAATIKPFDKIQQQRYQQLLNLRRAGWALFAVPYFIGKIFFGSDFIGLIGIVGVFIQIYAAIQLRPFRKTIREAGGYRILFSSSSDVLTEWEQQLTNPNTTRKGER